MILSFELSMPNNNAWNGRWSGEGKKYVIVKNMGNAQKTIKRLQPIIEEGYFYYDFGDGWGAAVTIKKVDRTQAIKLRKQSAGFCGYNWMVDEILTHGRILTLNERQRPRRPLT